MNKKPVSLGMARFGLGKDLEYLTHNLGLLLAAGVDVVSALDSIVGGIRSTRLKRMVSTMRDELIAGELLSVVFEKTGLFPPRVITLVRIGEESGQLVSQFKMISVQEEKQRTLRSKMRSALLYPGFVFLVTIIVGVGVSWFILPRLAKVFFQLKLELPFITKVVLGFGAFLGEYGVLVVPPLVLLFGMLIYMVFAYRRTKWIGEFILFSIPGVRQLIQEVELARLGFILGGLLRGGVNILEALDSLEHSTESYRYKRLYSHIRRHIEAGDSVEQSLTSHKGLHRLIPPPVQQLIIVGGKTGGLADALVKIGAAYEEKSDISTRNLSVILEPALLFIVWLAVVSVALGVVLPIYNLIGGINR